MRKASTKLEEGALIAGRYEVRGPAGAGLPATLYLVHDRDEDREVALEVVRASIATDPALAPEARMARRLLEEGDLARALDVSRSAGHPGIVPLLDAGVDEERGL